MTGAAVPAWALRADALAPDQIRALYRERLVDDFPPDEVKQLSVIETAMATGRCACYGALFGGETLVYAFFVSHGRLALLGYYAVRRGLHSGMITLSRAA